MDDSTKSTLVAVGVGVGATAAIATAMYFLGGRENPKLPSFGDVTGLAIGATRSEAILSDWSPQGKSRLARHWSWVETKPKSSQAASVSLLTSESAPHRNHPDVGKWSWSASAPGSASLTRGGGGVADTMAEAQNCANDWLQKYVT